MFDLMPFDRNERSLLRAMDRFDRDFFGDWNRVARNFQTDVLDEGDHYLLQAELPGFQKDDIQVNVDGDYLTIQAQHKEERENKDSKNYIRRERSYGSYSRTFQVSDVDVKNIQASYKNGILELKLPKVTEALSSISISLIAFPTPGIMDASSFKLPIFLI